MLNPTSLLADALGHSLAETYRRSYGDQEPHIAAGLYEAARLAIERIGSSDALYHDCQHTALVTLCVEERIAGVIELTRFPVPEDEDHAATDTEAGLVRAGDLIGQLGDPLYPRKLNALYHELDETGLHEKLGYSGPADLVDRYPQFYWSKVERYIGDALRYLEMTMEGKQWIAALYCHIFAIEHNRRRIGPQPGSPR
jgi:hypothetical protein